MNKKEIFLEKNRIARLFGREEEESNLERTLFLLTLVKKQKEASAILERIYQLLKDNQEDIKTFKELQEEMSRLIFSLNKYQESFSKEFNVHVKNFPAPKDDIKISNFEDIKFPAFPEFPDSFKISNLAEIKIPKFPERIEIKKPSWFENFDFIKLAKLLQNTISSLAGQIKKIVYHSVIKNTKPKEAIPVRLVTEDGERFYRAGDIYVTGGGGGISRKTNYLSRLLDANDVWQEFDLINTFIDAAIMNYEIENITIKLNSTGNDEITLAKSEAVDLENFALKKFYYKTTLAGKTSKVYLLAMR